MAAQVREKLTITADGLRTRGEHFRVRAARSLPRFLTTTPILEMKPRRVNKSKKKHDQKAKRELERVKEQNQKRPPRRKSRIN